MTTEILDSQSLDDAFALTSTGWDRTFLDAASKCAEPICWAYGLLRYRLVMPLDPAKFDNCESRIAEVAYRAFIALVGFFALTSSMVVPVALITLGIASKVLRVIGFALQSEGYTHVRGDAPETILQRQAKVAAWNVSGIGGGLHYDHGGLISWQNRLQAIVEKIEAEDPDVLVLQEIYDTALAEALIESLRERYAHFFIHLGANVMGSVGGCMVISKCAVHSFTNTSFSNNSWTLNRTFASLEIKANPADQVPCARIIGTHLIDDSNESRRQQVAEILESIQNSAPLPTVLMGDLNLERDRPEEGGILNPHFEHGYLGDESTFTDGMLRQWDETLADSERTFIDYISLYRVHAPEVRLLNTHLIRAYSPDFNTRTAISDHNGLSAILAW